MENKINKALVLIKSKAPTVQKSSRIMILLSLLSILLSGCTTYSGKFTCKDARGLPCTMLSDVAQKVNSGEIEKVYQVRKCAFGKCKVTDEEGKLIPSKPTLASSPIEAKVFTDELEPKYSKGDYLYVE